MPRVLLFVSKECMDLQKNLRPATNPNPLPPQEEFWAHARTHMKEEKILECPSCSFVTEYKHHLEYHIRNHIGSKPFKCDKCSYECVNKSMLNSHMKSHNNVYQYLCADCCYATKYCHSMKLHVNKYRHRPATILNHPELGGIEDRPMLAPPPPPASAAFNAAAAAAAAVAAASMREEAGPLDSTACRGLSLHMPPPQPQPAPMAPSVVTSSPSLWPPAFPSLLTAFTGAPYFPPGSNMPPAPLMPPPMGSGLLPPQPVLMKAHPERAFFGPRSSPDEAAALAPLGKRAAEAGGLAGPEGSPEAKRASPAPPEMAGDFPESAAARGPVPDQSYMECGHCDLFFRDHVMFDIHMGYHGYTNPFACNRCGYTAGSKVEFFLHLMQKSH